MRTKIMSVLLLVFVCAFHSKPIDAFGHTVTRTSKNPQLGSSNKFSAMIQMLSQSSFVRKPVRCRSRYYYSSRRKNYAERKNSLISMLRNVDLPETLIFYGFDTVIDVVTSPSQPTARPGVLRLIEEAKSVDVPTIILSEHMTMNELSEAVESAEPLFAKYREHNILRYRSSLEEFVVEEDGEMDEDDVPYRFVGAGMGHAPCPAALYDAVNTITIEPKGFGGSSGFGVKNWECERIPLAQHCVVFVCSASDNNKNDLLDRTDGSGSISRDRCTASRYSGMRVMYIEGERLSCSAEDVSDGIVDTLGTEQDWEMVTLDDISTPGSFWLNMMQPKDPDGLTVNTEDVIKEYLERRKGRAAVQNEPNEEELARDDNRTL